MGQSFHQLLKILAFLLPIILLAASRLPAVVKVLQKFSGLQSRHVADTIFTNGVIWTADDKLPWADSIAVRNGKILHIGSSMSMQDLVGSNTNHVDLEGKFVTPGFMDSHVHFIPGGLQLQMLNLHSTRSREELEEQVAMVAQEKEKGSWILGFGWNHENWGGNLPNKSWLDSITKNHPVWLTRIDGHMGLANSIALAKVGVNSETHDPQGGAIIRDERNGVLVDAAMMLVSKDIPQSSQEECREALKRASKHALSRGVTSVVDFGRFVPGASTRRVWDDFFEVYMWADAVGSMDVRVSIYFPLETFIEVADLVKEKGHVLSPWVHVGGVKAFADGSLGSSTALFHEPYLDDVNNYGLQVADPDWLLQATTEAMDSSLQVAIHAIGDAANDQILSLYEAALGNQSSLPYLRPRIEHAQHLSTEAPARFGALGIIASVQPQHLLDDAYPALRKLGKERFKKSYLFQSLLQGGARVTFGSDWPVTKLDPLEGIQMATKRVPHGFEQPWLVEQRISVEDALKGYTIVGAYSSHMEENIGSLSQGKYADFIILSCNLFNLSMEVVPFVLATYVGGLPVYTIQKEAT
ncbi:hypothetical protein O6H91_15G042300 [Diphasiastrum complanatum]|uniref:Uncharacterized protein n=1 Tax=Diphasiastrum complanatum TaxID=34168 RepID=A0ACC2BHS6_DIPCM|nr:hypothetical protein O6H91_15G042300 [Diphasiastrum complanatum]